MKGTQGLWLLAASMLLGSPVYADDAQPASSQTVDAGSPATDAPAATEAADNQSPAGQPADDQPAPGFDRPGIGFSTSIMPANSVAVELGLPDFSYSKQKVAGQTVRNSVYQTDVLLRTGLGGNAELQLGWQGPMWSRSKTAGQTQRDSGYGDTSIGLKVAVPLPLQSLSLAFLGGSSLTTGDATFGDDKRTASFGSTLNYQLNDRFSAALYGNVDRYDGENTWTASPSLSFNLTDRLGSFVEYGYSKSKGQPQQSVVGGGLTFMLCPRVQLDVSADLGVNDQAPDVQGGFGISIAL